MGSFGGITTGIVSAGPTARGSSATSGACLWRPRNRRNDLVLVLIRSFSLLLVVISAFGSPETGSPILLPLHYYSWNVPKPLRSVVSASISARETRPHSFSG